MTHAYPLKIPYTREVERFFRRNKIFLRNPFRFVGAYQRDDILTLPGPVKVERYATMPPGGFLQTGAFSYCRSPDMRAGSTIGRYCSLAKGVTVMGHSHPTDWISTSVMAFRPYAIDFAQKTFGKSMKHPPFSAVPRPVTIGHDVWIGENVMLKGGVSIGDGAIIAAGAIVTRDVEPYAVMGGVPARLIRWRFDDATIERLRASQWWRYNLADLGDLPMNEVHRLLDGLDERVGRGEIKPFEPGWVDLGAAFAKRLPQPPAV